LSAPVPVDDPSDPRVEEYVGLTDRELRRSVEGERGLFIAEGANVVRTVIDAGLRIRSVLVSPSRWASMAGALGEIAAPVYLASQPVIDRVAGFHAHRGVLASVARPPERTVDEVLADADPRCVAVLEAVNDPENLGSLFRNAAALGVDAVLLCPRCADPLYRRVVRVSMGAVVRLPYARFAAGQWPAAALEALAERGFARFALTPAADAQPISEAGVPLPERLAVLIGAEGAGLSPEALAAADRRLRIPMVAGVDSLNVAAAAAIAFYLLAGDRCRA